VVLVKKRAEARATSYSTKRRGGKSPRTQLSERLWEARQPSEEKFTFSRKEALEPGGFFGGVWVRQGRVNDRPIRSKVRGKRGGYLLFFGCRRTIGGGKKGYPR